MLKPIPQEPTQGKSKKQPQQKPQSKKLQQQKSLQLVKLQLKLNRENPADQNVLKSACVELIKYVKNAEAFSVNELNELIHNLQRSVLNLQRKKFKIIRLIQRKNLHQRKKKK